MPEELLPGFVADNEEVLPGFEPIKTSTTRRRPFDAKVRRGVAVEPAPKGNIFADVAKGVGGSVEKTIGGVGDIAYWAGEAVGNEAMSDWGKSFSDKMTELANTGWEAPDPKLMEGWKHPFRKSAYYIGGGVPQGLMLAIPGTLAFKGAKLLGAGVKLAKTAAMIGGSVPIGALVGGSTYREAREAGLTHNQATPIAFMSGVGEAVLESALPLNSWLKATKGTSLARRMLNVSTQEALEEVAQGFWTNALKVVGWKGTNDLYRDMTEGILEGAIAGFGAGATLGAFHSPAASLEDVSADMQRKVKKHKIKNPKTGKLYTSDETTQVVKDQIEAISRKKEAISDYLRDKAVKIAGSKAKKTKAVAREDEQSYEQATARPGKKGYDLSVEKVTLPTLGLNEGDEQMLNIRAKEIVQQMEIKAQGKRYGFTDLPKLMQQKIVRKINDDGPEGIQQFITQLLNDPNIYTKGGDFKNLKEGSPKSPVWFGPRLMSGKNPYVPLDEVITNMINLNLSPRNVTIFGEKSLEAMSTLAREYDSTYISQTAQAVKEEEIVFDNEEVITLGDEEDITFDQPSQEEVNEINSAVSMEATAMGASVKEEIKRKDELEEVADEVVFDTSEIEEVAEEVVPTEEEAEKEDAFQRFLRERREEGVSGGVLSEFFAGKEKSLSARGPTEVAKFKTKMKGPTGFDLHFLKEVTDIIAGYEHFQRSPQALIRALKQKGLKIADFIDLKLGDTAVFRQLVLFVDAEGTRMTRLRDDIRKIENLQRILRTYGEPLDVGEKFTREVKEPAPEPEISTVESLPQEPDLYTISFGKVTTGVEVEDGVVTRTAPILAKFEGQPVENLIGWIQEQKGTMHTVEDLIRKGKIDVEQAERINQINLENLAKDKLAQEVAALPPQVIREIELKKLPNLKLDEVPNFLKSTTTRDVSKVERQETDPVDEQSEFKAELTPEEIAEEERWKLGMREHVEKGRDTFDYVTSAYDEFDRLNIRLVNLIKTEPIVIKQLKEATSKKSREYLTDKLEITRLQIKSTQGHINDIRAWIKGLAVNNPIYHVNDGQVELKKFFLNLDLDITVGDAESGEMVNLPLGAYRLVPQNDKVMITDGVRVTVFPFTLLNIDRQGGDFTTEPNIAAGGKIHFFDGKGVEKQPAPDKDSQEYAMKLKLLIKAGKFIGRTEDQVLEFLGPDVVKNWTNAKASPKTIESIVRLALTEKRYNSFAAFRGAEVSDIIHRGVREFVEIELQQQGVPLTKESINKRVDAYEQLMFLAGADVIAKGKSITRYRVSDNGRGGAWPAGKRSADGNRDANIQVAIELHTLLHGTAPEPAMVQSWLAVRPKLFYFEQLPPKLQNWLLWGKAEVEDVLFEQQKKDGIFDRADNITNRMKGYFKGAYDFIDDKAKQNYYNTLLGRQGVPEKRYDDPAEFIISTREGADGAGLIPINNFSASLGMYTQEAMTRIQQTHMINGLKSINNPGYVDGGNNDILTQLGVVTYEQDVATVLKTAKIDLRASNFLQQNGYRKLKTEGLVEYFRGAFLQPWVRNDIADALEQIYNLKGANMPIKGWLRFNGAVKRFIMLSPYQFSLQIVSSPMLWFTPGVAWKTAIKPAITLQPIFQPILKRLKAKASGQIFREDPFEHLDNPDYDQKLLNSFIKNGASTFNVDWVFKALFDSKEMAKHPDKRSEFEDMMEFIGGKAGIDRHVFNEYVARNMYEFMKVYHSKLKADGLSDDEASKQAVKLANDQSGMLDPVIWGDEGPILQAVFFARNFTWSFMRQLTGATYPLWQHFHGYKVGKLSSLNSLMHADVGKTSLYTRGKITNAGMDVLWKYYLSHLTRIILAKGLFVALMQWAIMSAWKKIHPEDVEEGDENMALNMRDPGKFGLIKLPWKDPAGASAYIDPLLWREVSQFINAFPGLGRGPGIFIKNKLNVGFKTILEQLGNADFRGVPITDDSGNIPVDIRIKQRAVHFGKSILPSFLRESPKVSPFWNLSSIVGMPLKRGTPVGKGERIETITDIRKILSVKRWEDQQVQALVYEATDAELKRLFFERIITREQYRNAVRMRKHKAKYMFRRSRSTLREYKKRGYQLRR